MGDLLVKRPSYLPPKGMKDLLPGQEGIQNSSLWGKVEKTLRFHAHLWGCQEVRTPCVEYESLCSGMGRETDIAAKEVYQFLDRSGRSLILRPEGTAPVVRAYLNHPATRVRRFYYLGPMFRYERPQKGRYRQHSQFGVEVFGIDSPYCDAELISNVVALLEELGIPTQVLLNSLGTFEEQRTYSSALKEYLTPFYDQLSPESQSRLDKNPLRILDSKSAQDRLLLKEAPRIEDFLSASSAHHIQCVTQGLDRLGVAYRIDPHLVRGLDYYTHTVFEFCLKDQPSLALGGGGRYDNLVSLMGGQETPAVGFGIGVERLLHTLLDRGMGFPPSPPLVLLIAMGGGEECTLAMARDLRSKGLSVEVEWRQRRLGAYVHYAVEQGITYLIFLGSQEQQEGHCKVKAVHTKEEWGSELSQVAQSIHHHQQNP